MLPDKTRRVVSTLLALGAVATAIVLWTYVGRMQKIQQSSLRAESSLLAFLRETNTAIIEVDKDSKVVGWNPAAESIFGFTATDIVGKDLALILPEGDGFANVHREHVRKGVGHTSSERSYPITSLARSKAGKPVEVVVRVFFPQNSYTAVAIVNKTPLQPAPPKPSSNAKGHGGVNGSPTGRGILPPSAPAVALDPLCPPN